MTVLGDNPPDTYPLDAYHPDIYPLGQISPGQIPPGQIRLVLTFKTEIMFFILL